MYGRVNTVYFFDCMHDVRRFLVSEKRGAIERKRVLRCLAKSSLPRRLSKYEVWGELWELSIIDCRDETDGQFVHGFCPRVLRGCTIWNIY